MKQHDATYNRIESLVTTNELNEFMRQFAIVLQDIQTEEPFDAEDIISYLQIKMSNCPLVKMSNCLLRRRRTQSFLRNATTGK